MNVGRINLCNTAAGFYRPGMQPPGNQVMASATSMRGYSPGGVSYNPPPLQQTMFSASQYSQALNSQTMNFTGNPPRPQNPDDSNADSTASTEQPAYGVEGGTDVTQPNEEVAITTEGVPRLAARQTEETMQNPPPGDIMGSIAEEQKARAEIPPENLTAEEKVDNAINPPDTVTVP